MYVYAHTPLDEETVKLTSFPQVINFSHSFVGFIGLNGLPNFFTKQMSSFFKTLIEQGFALVYIDDILLFSNSREHMFQLIEQLPLKGTKHNLKLAPEKSFFMLLKAKFLDMKLVETQLNLNTLNLMQFTKSPLLLVKCPYEFYRCT